MVLQAHRSGCWRLTFFTFLAAGIIAGYMVYRVVAPVSADSAIDLTNFPGHPEDICVFLADRRASEPAGFSPD